MSTWFECNGLPGHARYAGEFSSIPSNLQRIIVKFREMDHSGLHVLVLKLGLRSVLLERFRRKKGGLPATHVDEVRAACITS